MAVLAQVLQLIGGWIAPLIIFFIKRQSRFVTFHALQVLLFELVWILLTMLVMGVVFLSLVLGVSSGVFADHGSKALPPFFLAFFGIFWLGFVAIWFVRLLIAILYGIKAGRGEWAEYPILGRLARKILNIGPGGAVIAS
jgi:uncharacterized membrane protein